MTNHLNETKSKAVIAALTNPETANLSPKEIAALCGVCAQTVTRRRRKMWPEPVKFMSYREFEEMQELPKFNRGGPRQEETDIE
jgi:DNA-binding MurR/RpiR family transcriptional regulator